MTIKEKQNRKNAIGELLGGKIKSRAELMAIKRKLAKKYGSSILLHSEILKEYRNRLKAGTIKRQFELERILRKRSVRTMSGIAPVAVLTKPYPCPGRCAYCPTEKGVPQSYLSNEPAVMRAIRCNYEPYKQVALRLRALEANGHEPTKIELIVIGGTWSALPENYKYWYITQCFRAANDYGKKITNYKLPCPRNVRQDKQITNKIQKLKRQLLKEQKKNESAKYNIIGITLETRPDYINDKELWQMRELGATRVELGVQAIDDKILKLNKRGHGVAEIARATEMLKNFGFKVTYHIMPGLPGATAKKDLAMFKKLFADERFQPDQLKFYPTVVTRGSLLYKWWKAGKYKPYSDKVLQNLIVACKKVVPLYVRIIRLIRDIPGESIIAGNMVTNLRQVMKDRGVACRCIRCREAKEQKFPVPPSASRGGNVESLKLKVIKYKASSGLEYFLSYESKDGKVLYGFCRLRLGSRNSQLATRNSIKNAALIRELHVYGELVSVGGDKKVQHAGLGKMLMQEAEKIARDNGNKKMAVIAGVGVRGYYRKLGYRLDNSYMVKNL
ncbi:tRNA uridine(34) 5-carboxymethylaminomethyl modification radical SAM/GNAT enzyme Elp3, partial [Patescibacteria group bacterium]|nr:tRNA uridine(34) 5-carboxymethylaminomethyl modification radical SAM/GNAT enzyme Elp3 [Patescibacteria group bacterium]